jgi:putative DNA primase/helicase
MKFAFNAKTQHIQYRKPAPIDVSANDNDTDAQHTDDNLTDEPVAQDNDPAENAWGSNIDFDGDELEDTRPEQGTQGEDAQPSTVEFDDAEVAKIRAHVEHYDVPDVPGFRHTAEGLEKEMVNKKGEKFWAPVCTPIWATALIRDYDSLSWALQVKVIDADGVEHIASIPNALRGDSNALRDLLGPLGLIVRPYPSARVAVAEWATLTNPNRRIRTVKSIGWLNDGKFVLPEKTYGATEMDQIVLDGVRNDHTFRSAGTLQEWQDNVAIYAVGNPRIGTAFCGGLAGPLLGLIDADSRGLHFYGNGSTGKTTILEVASSIWGGGSKKGNIQSWKTTVNALEGIARARSYTAMFFDELGQIQPDAFWDAIYMLGNGMGKARMTKDGGNRPVTEWSSSYISVGEISAEQKLAQGGHTMTAGQMVRLIDIPADAGEGYGCFNNLHGFPNGAQFSNHLKAMSKKHYGVASDVFLEKLVADREAITPLIRDAVEQFTEEHSRGEPDGQVIRVISHFGILACAGELATSMGILPWKQGEATNAVVACMGAWLEHRGGEGSAEMLMAVKQVRETLARHSTKHFDMWVKNSGHEKGHVDAKALDRWGFRTEEKGENHFYATAVGFGKLCEGFDKKATAKELAKLGILLPSHDGKSSVAVDVPTQDKARYYHLVLRESDEVSDGE